MSIYTVTATRWAHGWELDIDGVGVTQARSLGEVDAMLRDYVALMVSDDAARNARFDHQFRLRGAEDEIADVRSEYDELLQKQAQLAVRTRKVALMLRHQGLTGRDIAIVLGVSPQRVSQLINSEAKKDRSGLHRRVAS